MRWRAAEPLGTTPISHDLRRGQWVDSRIAIQRIVKRLKIVGPAGKDAQDVRLGAAVLPRDHPERWQLELYRRLGARVDDDGDGLACREAMRPQIETQLNGAQPAEPVEGARARPRQPRKWPLMGECDDDDIDAVMHSGCHHCGG